MTMATSEELLHVDPSNVYSPFVLNKSKDRNCSDNQQPPCITRMEHSSVLSRVRDFIPLLASANHDLQKEIEKSSTSKFDIEDVDGDQSYIEMNIGIFAKGDKETQSSSSDESDSDILDEENVCKMLQEVTEKTLKIQREEKKQANLITEIKTAKANKTSKRRPALRKRKINSSKRKR